MTGTGRGSSATDEALVFLARLERWVAADGSSNAPALRTALLSHLRAEQAAQASSGLIHQLAGRALEVADAAVGRAEKPPAVRTQLEQSCAAERGDLEGARAAVTRTALALLDGRGAWSGGCSSMRSRAVVPGRNLRRVAST